MLFTTNVIISYETGPTTQGGRQYLVQWSTSAAHDGSSEQFRGNVEWCSGDVRWNCRLESQLFIYGNSKAFCISTFPA